MNRGDTSDLGARILGYEPSRSVGIGAVTCAALLTFFHAALAIISRRGRRTRGSFAFHFLLAFGSAWEVVGYAFRLQRPFGLNPFIIQYFFIVCAPVFFTAALYLGVTLLVRASPASARFLPPGATPRRVIWTFVTVDVITIIMQIAGAGLIGGAYSARGDGRSFSVTPDQANDILLAGLCIQCFFAAVFLLILIAFTVRGTRAGHLPSPLFVGALISATLLLLLRTAFRLAESAEGALSSIFRNQDLFLIEIIPIIVAVALLAIFAPLWTLRATASAKDVDY